MPFPSDIALVITMVTGHGVICGNALQKELNKCKLSDSYAALILKDGCQNNSILTDPL